jgi:hypothetical protein
VRLYDWSDYAMSAKDTQVGGGHYKDFVIQPFEFITKNRIPYAEANVIKYVCRHRQKNGRQDLEKAIHYLQLLLDSEYPDRTSDDDLGDTHLDPRTP